MWVIISILHKFWGKQRPPKGWFIYALLPTFTRSARGLRLYTIRHCQATWNCTPTIRKMGNRCTGTPHAPLHDLGALLQRILGLPCRAHKHAQEAQIAPWTAKSPQDPPAALMGALARISAHGSSSTLPWAILRALRLDWSVTKGRLGVLLRSVCRPSSVALFTPSSWSIGRAPC